MNIADSIDEIKKFDIDQKWLSHLDEILTLGSLLEYSIRLETINYSAIYGVRNSEKFVGYHAVFIKGSIIGKFIVMYKEDQFYKVEGSMGGRQFRMTYEPHITKAANDFKEWM